MRKDYLYIGFLILSVSAFVISEALKPEEVDFSPDYTRNRSLPIATEILFNELNVLFPDQQITFNESTFYLFEGQQKPQNLLFINSEFRFDQLETQRLLSRVRNGDHLFISGIPVGPLADSLDLDFTYFYALFDSTMPKSHTGVSIQSPVTDTDSVWVHQKDLTYYFISDFDSAKTHILGAWDDSRINFVRLSLESGTIYVHTNPELLTNYYVRDPGRARYAFTVLSHLPVQHTVWDTYYKDGRSSAETPLYVVLETPNLRQAWQLSIVLLILFMIIRARRKQRVVPVIEPFSNSTVQFTRTIASLYLEQGDVSGIIKKRIRFFREYVRTNLNLDISDLNDESQKDLSKRSGVSKELAGTLIQEIRSMEIKDTPDHEDLKIISTMLDTFYNQSER